MVNAVCLEFDFSDSIGVDKSDENCWIIEELGDDFAKLSGSKSFAVPASHSISSIVFKTSELAEVLAFAF